MATEGTLDYKPLMAKIDELVDDGQLTEDEYIKLANALKFHKDNYHIVKQMDVVEADQRAIEAQLLASESTPTYSTSPANSSIPSWVRDTMSITFDR